MSNSFFIFYFINTYSSVTYKRRYPLYSCFVDPSKTGYPLSRTDPCTGTENRVPLTTARERHDKAQHRAKAGTPAQHRTGHSTGKARHRTAQEKQGTPVQAHRGTVKARSRHG